MWAVTSCDVGARWGEFGPPYINFGGPREMWADIVSIWADGRWDMGRQRHDWARGGRISAVSSALGNLPRVHDR